MSNETVKVHCTECNGAGYVEAIVGGSIAAGPTYREIECDECGGAGHKEMTRAELLERNIEAGERKKEQKEMAEAWRKRNAKAV